MSILLAEIPPYFGAFDSDAFEELDLPDAALMYAIDTGANRLLCRSEPLVNMVWDVGSTATEGGGSVEGYAPPIWIPLIPGPLVVCKKPGLERAKLLVRSKVTTGEVIQIQVATLAMPFNPAASASSPNVLEITGSGAWQDDDLSAIPIRYEVDEQVQFYIRGKVTATIGDVVTYGTLQAGTLDTVLEHDTLVDTSSAWNRSRDAPPSWAWGHAIVCKDAASSVILTAWIVDVPDVDRLRIFPAIASAFTERVLAGASYEIFQVPHYQLGQVALYATERES